MLNSLRNAAGSWVAKLLLVLLVLSFAVWGVSGTMLSGLGSRSVVTAGKTEVSPVEYRLAYDRQISILSQRFGQRLTSEQARALGVDNQVLAQLVAGAVLDEQAREMQLGLSKDRLAELTADDPAFRNASGQFDRVLFERVLANAGMRPQDYLKNREQVARRQQIIEAVSGNMEAPSTFLKAVALYQGENRTVEYITLPPSIVEPLPEPSDAEISAYFEENKLKYRAPEYRKITYLKLDAAAIADPTSVSDEALREDYEKNRNRFLTPETRVVEQLVFPDADKAADASARLKAGTTFEQLVESEGKSLTDISLGAVKKSDIPDPAIADAAFDLQQNAVSDVVKGAFGHILLRVSAITPEVVQPFDDVKDALRNELAQREAVRILLDVHDSYEDSRAGGDTLAEAAAKLQLETVTVDAIDRSGRDMSGNIINTLPESARLLREAFETETGIENPSIPMGTDGFVWYEVEGITPARDRTLDEVRETVVTDWREAKLAELMAAKAGELQKRVKDGASLDDIATETELEKQVKRGLVRGTEDPDFGADGTEAVFAGPNGYSGVITAPSGNNRILFKVTEVFEPVGASAEALDEETRNGFKSAVADDLLDQLVAGLQAKYQVTSNPVAIDQALGRSRSSN